MISLILLEKICALLLVLFSGVLLVRVGVLDRDASKPLSSLLVYLVTPCSVISSFQLEYSADTRDGLFLAAKFGLMTIIIMIAAMHFIGHILHMSTVEIASVDYANAGNLIIPIVSAVWGSEYVIFCSAYICIQLFFMWSHGKSLLCGEKGIDIKKILLNCNIIAVLIGLVCFFGRITFPTVIGDTLEWVADMIGPLAMLIAGIQLGGTSLRQVLGYRRVWLVAALRLAFFPLLWVVLFRLLPLGNDVAESETIKAITLLGMIGPSASNITAMSRLFGGDAQYASVINMVTTILCAATIPMIMAIYGV